MSREKTGSSGVRPRAVPDRRRDRRSTQPPRTGSRKPGNARHRRHGSYRAQPSPASRSARRIGHRDCASANPQKLKAAWFAPFLFSCLVFLLGFLLAYDWSAQTRVILIPHGKSLPSHAALRWHRVIVEGQPTIPCFPGEVFSRIPRRFVSGRAGTGLKNQDLATAPPGDCNNRGA
jgi:hypothetical protein